MTTYFEKPLNAEVSSLNSNIANLIKSQTVNATTNENSQIPIGHIDGVIVGAKCLYTGYQCIIRCASNDATFYYCQLLFNNVAIGSDLTVDVIVYYI